MDISTSGEKRKGSIFFATKPTGDTCYIIHNPTIVNIYTIKRSRDAFIYLDKFSRLMINKKMIALIMVLSFVMFGAAVVAMPMIG